MLIAVVYVYFFPEVILGTENPGVSNYLFGLLFFCGGLGVFVFWTWGVVANVVSFLTDPIEREREKGWLKPGSYGDRMLKNVRLFKLLNIYIEDNKSN